MEPSSASEPSLCEVDLGKNAEGNLLFKVGGNIPPIRGEFKVSSNEVGGDSSVQGNKLVGIQSQMKKTSAARSLSFNETGETPSLFSNKKPRNKVFKKKISKSSVNIINDFDPNVAGGSSEDYNSVILIKKVVENARKRKSSEGSKDSSKDACLSPRSPLTCVFEGASKTKSKSLQAKRKMKPASRSLSCVVGKSNPEILSSGGKFVGNLNEMLPSGGKFQGVNQGELLCSGGKFDLPSGGKFVGATIFNSDIFLASTSDSVAKDPPQLPSEPVQEVVPKRGVKDKAATPKLKKKKRRKVVPRKSI